MQIFAFVSLQLTIPEKAIPYYATLGAINFAALLFSLQQAYNTRKLATEFSESRYIFYAMIGILVALFQGIPVLILVRDDPDVQDFIKCTVIFVTCSSVLIFLFVPKMRYLVKRQTKTRTMLLEESVHVSGLVDANGSGPIMEGSSQLFGSQRNMNHSTLLRQRYHGSGSRPVAISGLSNISGLSGCSSGNSSDEEGIRFTTLSHEDLRDENKNLRKKLDLLHCDLGTLATDSSVSAESNGSSGIRIISRKSQYELMQENKQLKKLLKTTLSKNVAMIAQATINEGEKESESEALSVDDRCEPDVTGEQQVLSPECRVSFNLSPLAKFPIESPDLAEYAKSSSRDEEAANGIKTITETTESTSTTEKTNLVSMDLTV